MSINFFKLSCQDTTNQSEFGLCDDPPPPHTPAYIDLDISNKDEKWIAIVDNSNEIEITFTAIDNCIEIRRPNGEMDKSCEGMLTYQNSIIFVELKKRGGKNSAWAGGGDNQLRNTIRVFKENHSIDDYHSKIAYIANKKKPNFQSSQKVRMDKFKDDTGFRLRIENTIKIESS